MKKYRYDVKKARAFASAYAVFQSIENDNDLKKNNISLSDYYIIGDLLKEFSTLPDYWLLCTFSAVAAWFKNNGLRVKYPDRENINYRISLY